MNELLVPERVSRDDQHVYTTPDGKLVPGVTTILGVRQKIWYPNWVLKESRLAVLKEITGTTQVEEDGKIKSQEWGIPNHSLARAVVYGGREFESVQEWTKRVNGILKGCSKAHKAKSDAALDVGTDVHEQLNRYIKLKISLGHQAAKEMVGVPLTWLDTPSLKAFLDWEAKNDVEWLYSERIVFCKERWYAGTFDFLARLRARGMVVLGDFKTSARISEDYALQTAGYVQAMEEEHTDARSNMAFMHGWSNMPRLILRLDKEGKGFEEHFIPTDLQKDIDGFNACLGVYNWNNYSENVSKGGNNGR